MPSLKDLRNRIASVKATQKITKAMQMVAAAKLRRAQSAAEAARRYASRMETVLANLATALQGRDGTNVIEMAVCQPDRVDLHARGANHPADPLRLVAGIDEDATAGALVVEEIAVLLEWPDGHPLDLHAV